MPEPDWPETIDVSADRKRAWTAEIARQSGLIQESPLFWQPVHGCVARPEVLRRAWLLSRASGHRSGEQDHAGEPQPEGLPPVCGLAGRELGGLRITGGPKRGHPSIFSVSRVSTPVPVLGRNVPRSAYAHKMN